MVIHSCQIIASLCVRRAVSGLYLCVQLCQIHACLEGKSKLISVLGITGLELHG